MSSSPNPFVKLIALLCIAIGYLVGSAAILLIGILGIFLAYSVILFALDVCLIGGAGWIFGIPLLAIGIFLLILVTFPDSR